MIQSFSESSHPAVLTTSVEDSNSHNLTPEQESQIAEKPRPKPRRTIKKLGDGATQPAPRPVPAPRARKKSSTDLGSKGTLLSQVVRDC